jgi:Mg-chelatase subunit ChlD
MNRETKWRLILGKAAEEENDDSLPPDLKEMDAALDALYDANRKGGLGSSAPKVNRWLGDIRKYFNTDMVQIMQKDALDRLDLKQMLLEPEMLEQVEPDVHLVGTLLSLNRVIPEHTRNTAREVVRKVVQELEKKLRQPMRQAVYGSLSRAIKNRRPKLKEIDWNQTIRANLKNYQPDYKTIIPEILRGTGRKGSALKEVILCVDQSGSMAASVVYSSVFGAILASMNAVRTQMVVFDTSVVDLTEELHDPVDILFGTQLGGGTDINRALAYCEGLVRQPADTIMVLITDLYEGGNKRDMLRRMARIKDSGVTLIVLLALSDEGASFYDQHTAADIGTLGIAAFACTPELFPDLMATAIQQGDIRNWAIRNNRFGE